MMPDIERTIIFLLASPDIALWQAEIIENAASHPKVNVCLAISQTDSPKHLTHPSIFSHYRRWDEAFFSQRIDSRNALTSQSIHDFSTSIEICFLGHVANHTPIEADLLIVLENIPPDAIPDKIDAKSTWFFQVGDQPEASSFPALQEVYDLVPSIQVKIFSHSRNEPLLSGLLYESSTAVHPYSYYGTLNPCLWKAKTALTRLILQYLEDTPQGVEPDPKPVLQGNWTQSFNIANNPIFFVLFLFKVLWRYARHKYRCLFYNEQFMLAYRFRQAGLPADNDFEDFRIIEPQPHEFWADPFLFQHLGTHYLFFENFDYQKNKGKISVLPIPQGIQTKTPLTAPEAVDVLETPYHLSYPFLFQDGETIYMMPETTENNAIELYQAERFPTAWKKADTLMTGIKAHDATLLKHNGLYWLFANIEADSTPFNDELYIFYSNALLGEWTPHPRNPVVRQVENARSAGRIFQLGNQIIRPIQDCSVCYGYALNFNEINVLSRTDYQEELIRKIKPYKRKGFHGIHAYDANEQFEVIDMAKYVRKKRFLRKLGN